MQLLKPINVGQAPNDQTGDTLRDAMALVNENFAKTRAGVEAVEVATAAAQRKADAAVPMSEKGAACACRPSANSGAVGAAGGEGATEWCGHPAQPCGGWPTP